METQEHRPRGRPKDMEKRAAILRAARKLFFAYGLATVTIDQIAHEAGVSKMTVYANFPDKAAIFEAVVAEDGLRMDEAFAHLQIGAGSIDVVLTRLGNELMTFLMSPEVMRLDRMLGAEMTSHPTVGQGFYRAGPERMWKAVSDILAEATARGEVWTDDPRQAAEDLIALWLGMLPLQFRFDKHEAVSQSEIAKRVRHGVRVFMSAYGQPV
jgi:TetR/AcrR family transcriptional regulator, mexJK operon transcriptional repressor